MLLFFVVVVDICVINSLILDSHHLRWLKYKYGIPYNEQEPYTKIIGNTLDAFSEAAIVLGLYLVNTIPMLRYVPAWFPFVQFKNM